VVDGNGVSVYNDESEITVTVEGPARLLGLESGSMTSHEDYKANKRKTFNGQLVAYIQSNGKPGPVTVTLSSPGLQPRVIQINK